MIVDFFCIKHMTSWLDAESLVNCLSVANAKQKIMSCITWRVASSNVIVKFYTHLIDAHMNMFQQKLEVKTTFFEFTIAHLSLVSRLKNTKFSSAFVSFYY